MKKRYTPDNPMPNIVKKERLEKMAADSFGYSELVQKYLEEATVLLAASNDSVRILLEDENFRKIGQEEDEDDRDDLIAQVLCNNPEVIPVAISDTDHKLAFIQALSLAGTS